jgi:hypothetical protein
MNEAAKSAPSVGDLLGSLATETGTLVRQELTLASTELRHKVNGASLEIGMISLGGALGLAGLLALMFGAITALAVFVPVWASAAALGVVFLAIGALVIRHGVAALRGLDPVPERTVRTLQDGKGWMKEQLR